MFFGLEVAPAEGRSFKGSYRRGHLEGNWASVRRGIARNGQLEKRYVPKEEPQMEDQGRDP